VVEAVEEVTETVPKVEAVSAADIAEAAGGAISAALAPLVERMEALEGTMKELSSVQAEQRTELEMTPAASLAQMIKSAVIGSDATRIDGRKKAASDKPKETASVVGSTGIGFVDDMKAGRDWRDSV
jgi:hypothetical protein